MEIGRLVLGSWSKATALGERDNSDHLCGFAGVDPAAQEGNTLGGPWSVARHPAGVETIQDGVGMRRDVPEGP